MDISNIDVRDLREVPDGAHSIRLLAKPLDVHFRSGRWMGAGAEYIEAAIQSRRVYANYEPDAILLHWPKRICIKSLTLVHVELRRAIIEHHAEGTTQEQADAQLAAGWPEADRQTIIPPVTPFALVALEGAKIVGEILVEVE